MKKYSGDPMSDKPCILIIDDDAAFRKTLTDILRVKGYEAIAAGDGTKGLSLMWQNDVNLVLIDLALPDVSGLIVLDRVMVDFPATEAIILTGNATLDSAIHAANRGAFSYLVKPYQIEQLLLLIKRAIEKQQSRQALQESEERFRKIFKDGPLGMAVVGLDYSYVKVNNMLCRITGYTEEEFGLLHYADIAHPEDIEDDAQNLKRLQNGEIADYKREKRTVRKNGEYIWVSQTISLIRDEGGAALYFLEMAEDISERKQFEERLAYQASHDELTALPNRNLLADRIRQALLHAHRYHRQVAVMFIDLDHFKFINDSLGHDSGDQLLKIIAGRLSACVRSGDTVARQGGDDFVVVLSDMARSEDAAKIVNKIQTEVCRPIKIEEHDLEVTCSIGISAYPRDGTDVQELMKNADVAMFRAKEQGRNNFQYYTRELNDKAVERVIMEKHMRKALGKGEFLLHYQPQVDLVNGRITGMEALLRWKSPELGFLPPNKFIPLAEETGLIEPIGEWVLKTACEQNRKWHQTGLPQLSIAVNLSPRQFRQEGFVEAIGRILHQTGLEAQYLELEIVESLLMQDVENSTFLLNKINELGIQLTMDDFGTGFSSLSYLKRFKFDKLKIDRSFVRDITSDPDSAAIARAIIAMAHSLKLKVIAEGVETEGQLCYLRAQGCDEMQGFYFSRPVPSGEFEQMLLDNRCLEFSGESDHPAERTVLLVDDEPHVVITLGKILRNEGYNVLTANSTEAGFELLATNQVGVIIVDLCMPDMYGTEFLTRVMKLHPHIVRILLSGRADMDSLTDAVNRSAIFKFLIKPCKDDSLRENIKAAFLFYEMTQKNDLAKPVHEM
jgi:diguanylate cyclase (GGDEF)-like protein/PAS domain S-box-containing protein